MNRLVYVFVGIASGAALSACGDDGNAADAGPPPDAPITAGTMSLVWEISDGSGGIACDDVGGVSVSLSATPVGGVVAQIDAFGCQAGQATSRALEAGSYNVRIQLRAADGSLGEPITMSNVEVTAGGNTDLGSVTFEVEPQGNFTFTVEAEATGLNCDAQDADGGGITELVFELRDADGACVPAEFDIAAGAAQPAGTYAVDCAATYGCIENDQAITVAEVPSGPHRLVIRASIGETECYMRTAQFTIPGGNLSFDLGTQMLSLMSTVECDPNYEPPDAGMN